MIIKANIKKTKRIRTIQPSWLKEYPWLRYNKISELYTEEGAKNIKRFLTELNKERKKKREDDFGVRDGVIRRTMISRIS
jgi:hypothetical protein